MRSASRSPAVSRSSRDRGEVSTGYPPSKPMYLLGFFRASHSGSVAVIDVIVANASIEMSRTPVLDFTQEDYDRLFDMNTKGVFFTMHKAAKYVPD